MESAGTGRRRSPENGSSVMALKKILYLSVHFFGSLDAIIPPILFRAIEMIDLAMSPKRKPIKQAKKSLKSLKSAKASKAQKHQEPKQSPEDKMRDYSERLTELENELSTYPARQPGTAQSALPSLSHVEAEQIGSESVIQFAHRKTVYAVGHTDMSFPGTNGARGVRRIHFYDELKKIVLGVVGEFDNHQLGVNFRSSDVKTYHPGEWEKSFIEVTTGLRAFRADRKEELRQIRATSAGRRD